LSTDINNVEYLCGKCGRVLGVRREDRYQLSVSCGCGFHKLIPDPDAPPAPPRPKRLSELTGEELQQHLCRVNRKISEEQFGPSGSKRRFY
jgi:hypothetical protein